MPLVFLAFVLVPIAEIAVFIEVGGFIGLWPTLAIVILTAFLGAGLLRAQGLAAFRRAQLSMAEGRLPVEEVVHGFCLVIAGALLLTPGFLTDMVGFLLFLPPVRLALGRAALKWIAKHGTVHVHSSGGPFPGTDPGSGTRKDDPTVVDGEAEEVHPTEPQAHNDDTPPRWIPPKD